MDFVIMCGGENVGNIGIREDGKYSFFLASAGIGDIMLAWIIV